MGIFSIAGASLDLEPEDGFIELKVKFSDSLGSLHDLIT